MGKTPVVELKGAELQMFLQWFKRTDLDCLWNVKLAFQDGGVKVKFNETVWTIAVGERIE